MKRVLMMAGGTGGHIFPALTVADELQQRGIAVHWLGTRAGMEAHLVVKAGFPIHYVSVVGLRGKGWSHLLSVLPRLVLSFYQAVLVMVRVWPHVVVSMGGYTSGPGGIAAWILRRPLLVHEQNAVPGLTNRILSRLAAKVLSGFPAAFPRNTGVIVTGNPVRSEIVSVPSPQLRFQKRDGRLRLLVLGGSQGAAKVNERVLAALAELDASECPEVWHQSGKQHLLDTQRVYEQAGVTGKVVAFIDDMSAAYAWADVVLCRSGAMTVAELAVVGIGSVLIPLPYAVDDHQTRNGMYLVDANAAVMVAEDKLTAESLADLLKQFIRERQRLVAMAEAARRLGNPHAAQRVAEQICGLL